MAYGKYGGSGGRRDPGTTPGGRPLPDTSRIERTAAMLRAEQEAIDEAHASRLLAGGKRRRRRK